MFHEISIENRILCKFIQMCVRVWRAFTVLECTFGILESKTKKNLWNVTVLKNSHFLCMFYHILYIQKFITDQNRLNFCCYILLLCFVYIIVAINIRVWSKFAQIPKKYWLIVYFVGVYFERWQKSNKIYWRTAVAKKLSNN